MFLTITQLEDYRQKQEEVEMRAITAEMEVSQFLCVLVPMY